MRQDHPNEPRTLLTASRRYARTSLAFMLLLVCTSRGTASESEWSSVAAASESRGIAAHAKRPVDAATSPEVWLCAGKGVLDLLTSGAQWPFVREHLSGIQFYIDMIDRATPEQLGQLVRLIRGQGYQVSIECGGTLDFAPMDETNGEVSARIELAKLAKFYAAGGRVDFLNLDGPIRRLMHPDKRREGTSSTTSG